MYQKVELQNQEIENGGKSKKFKINIKFPISN